MPHRNPEFFHGPTFEQLIEQAVEEHTKLVADKEAKHYWKEPSQHDILYGKDPISGQRLFYPSGVPAEPALGQPEPEDISDRIRRQIQGQALLNLARELGAETFEEANDFNVEEGQDLCPFSGHEYDEQDENADHLRYAELKKLKDEQDAAEALAKKKQEYAELRKAFEAENPSSPPASDSQE